MKKSTLQREDIVGQQIRCIYQSPWEADDDGFGGCSAYIELEDGDVFELLYHDIDLVVPIENVSLGGLNVAMVSDSYLTMCFGKQIREVLKSEYWPTFGLLLESNIFLYTRDFPNINRSGALLIGPYADKVGEQYSTEDVAPYWYFDSTRG